MKNFLPGKHKFVSKTFMLGIIIALMLSINVFAAGRVEIINSPNYVLSKTSDSRLLFLFSSGKINETQSQDIYAVFSNIEINGEINGKIYSFFSKISVSGTVNGSIKTLSSLVEYQLNANVSELFKALSFLVKTGIQDGTYFFSDEIKYLNVFLSAVMIFLSYLALAVKKSFIEQGAMAYFYEPIEIFKNGIIYYLLLLVLTIITIASLFLAPVGILFIAIIFLVFVCGEASLAILISHIIADFFKLKLNIFVKLLIGAVVIEILRNMPFIGFGFSYVFFPILAFGTVVASIFNGFLKKRFYPSAFAEEFKPSLNFGDLRNKLLK